MKKKILSIILVVFITGFLSTSCDKIKDKMSKKKKDRGEDVEEIEDVDGDIEEVGDIEDPEEKKDPDDEVKDEPEEKKGLSEEGEIRKAQLFKEFEKTVAKPDKTEVLKKLVQEQYNINLDELFPGGYDESKFKSLVEAKRLLKDKAKEETKKVFTLDKYKAVEQEAIKLYPLYEINSKVVVKTRKNDTIRGNVTAVEFNYIMVNQHKILLNDIKTPDPSLFSELKVEDKRRMYLKRNYHDLRDQRVATWQKEHEDEFLEGLGFIKQGKQWISLRTIINAKIRVDVDKHIKFALSRREKRIRNMVREKLVEEGFIKEELD